MSSNVIAIDGPAASGKSTVAKLLAERLNIPYLSTGTLYRALAWKMKQRRINVDTIGKEELAQFLAGTRLALRRGSGNGDFEVEIDGVRPGEALREDDISAGASKIGTYPAVRAWLLDVQRRLAGETRIVMEGRDIGTAIFPDARYKFFLTASPEIRAVRRLTQDGKTPDAATLARVAAGIAARDEQDRTRAAAPLKQADDAVFLDNSDMVPEQILQFILGAMKRKDVLDTVLRYRVPYADTDQMGVVYYANYLIYFEMFRAEMFRAAGQSYNELEKRGIIMPVIEAVCRYRAPARFEDLIEVTGRVAACRGVRVRIECQIHCRGRLLAEGHTVHACVNRTGKPVRVPQSIAELMNPRKGA